jgi:DNA-binding response OmpR family regulator
MDPLRILVVDDHPQLLAMLQLLLDSFGYLPQPVGSADSAILACETAPPALMLVDQNLGDRDGLSLAAEVRERWPQVPVVLMTGGIPDPMFVGRAVTLGVPIIAKPFDPVVLQQDLRRWITRGATV